MPNYGSFEKGITLSRLIQTGFDDIENGDIHKEIGSFTSQDVLAKESGSTVDKPCYRALAPNGDVFLFSKTDGDIFKRTQAGVYSQVYTNTQGAHKGAIYYRGYIYYTTDSKLGRQEVAVASSESTWTSSDDSFQSLTAGVAHEMEEFDLILYITNGKDIAQFDDADVFSSSGLDLPLQYEATALKAYGDDLLIGAKAGNYINDSRIFRWDTFTSSWKISDPIKEVGIHTFIDADNFIFVIAGNQGNVYLFTGTQLDIIKQIRSVDTNTFNAQMSTNHKGRALIANGSRVYSIHRKTRDLEMSLSGEYQVSAGSTAQIQSIVASGDDLIIPWTLPGTPDTYGVDNITSNKATAAVYTPIFGEAETIEVSYLDLPTGTSIAIAVKQDGETSYTNLEVEVDSEDERKVRLKNRIDIKSDAQSRITLNPSGTSAPVIDNVIVK